MPRRLCHGCDPRRTSTLIACSCSVTVRVRSLRHGLRAREHPWPARSPGRHRPLGGGDPGLAGTTHRAGPARIQQVADRRPSHRCREGAEKGAREDQAHRPLRRPRSRASAGDCSVTGCGACESGLECDADPRTHCLTRRRARRGSFLRFRDRRPAGSVVILGVPCSMPARRSPPTLRWNTCRPAAFCRHEEAALCSRGQAARRPLRSWGDGTRVRDRGAGPLLPFWG